MAEVKFDLFWPYLSFDELGLIKGICGGAPEAAKKEYEKFAAEQEEAKRNGLKI